MTSGVFAGTDDSDGGSPVLSDPATDRAALAAHCAGSFHPTDTVRILAGGAGYDGVEATSARFLRHRFRPHTHETIMLGLIEAGTKAFKRERKTWVAPPGAVSIVNPGELHTGERVAGDELLYRAIYVPPALLAQAVGVDGAPSHATSIDFAPGVVIDLHIARLLRAAHEALVRQNTRLGRETLLLLALSELVSRYGTRRFGKPARTLPFAPSHVRTAQRIIDQRYVEELAISDLAAVANVSVYHLMRQFRHYVGMPIHAYQLQKRIESAKVFLRKGERVANVALEVGFADQSHFSKRFKDFVGATPAAYQRDVRR